MINSSTWHLFFKYLSNFRPPRKEPILFSSLPFLFLLRAFFLYKWFLFIMYHSGIHQPTWDNMKRTWCRTGLLESNISIVLGVAWYFSMINDLIIWTLTVVPRTVCSTPGPNPFPSTYAYSHCICCNYSEIFNVYGKCGPKNIELQWL